MPNTGMSYLSLSLKTSLEFYCENRECTEFEVYLCLNPSFKRMMKGSNTKFALAVCEFSWGLPECGVVLMESSQKWLSLTAIFLLFKSGKAGKNKYLGFVWDAFFGFRKRKMRKRNVSSFAENAK